LVPFQNSLHEETLYVIVLGLREGMKKEFKDLFQVIGFWIKCRLNRMYFFNFWKSLRWRSFQNIPIHPSTGNDLAKRFSTDGSWKISNGSWTNIVFYFEWLNLLKLSINILNCGSWKFFFKYTGRGAIWVENHWSSISTFVCDASEEKLQQKCFLKYHHVYEYYTWM
jgi:hypothetical protein